MTSMIWPDDDADAAALVLVDEDGERLARGAEAVHARGVPTLEHQSRDVDEVQDLLAVLDDGERAGVLELGPRELLEPGDQLERDRHAPALVVGEHEQRDPVGLDVRGLLAARTELALLLARQYVGAPGEPEHVQDQADAAVAEDRRAGERVDALQVAAERLHHDLGRVVHAVDDQAEAPVVGLEHDDRAGRPRSGRAIDAELGRQGHER